MPARHFRPVDVQIGPDPSYPRTVNTLFTVFCHYFAAEGTPNVLSGAFHGKVYKASKRGQHMHSSYPTAYRGFTLVEIMIVVVIIGLLATMAIPAFRRVSDASQDKAVLNNARQLSSASDQYFLESGVSTV